ncbi:GNAT family N-acetyltransferase [Methanolobus sp. ZRKC2]|uniref:GNAT family N-acetyltransferase n=1 Tax=Methanolobus sp. ZRKC2 TaxID=3125783 RepID=UPI0032537FC1
MANIRPFSEEDNKTLLSIEKLCPQGDERLAMVIDKGPEITIRYEIYDNWQIMVAEEEGQTAGWIGWTVKQHPDEQYIYMAEVMVHPDFRRKGIAVSLIREAEEQARSINATHLYCYVYAHNQAFISLLEKLGYIRKKEIMVCEMSAYRKEETDRKYTLERIEDKDLPEAVELLNRYYAGRTHFSPFTPESFREYANRILGYGLENFLAAKENGKIVACGGFWDSAVLMEMAYTKEPILWKTMSKVFGMLRHFTAMPKVPEEGEYFKLRLIVDHAFETGYKDAMEEILGYCNNILYDAKCDFFGTYIDPDDDFLEVIKHHRPQFEKMYLYARPVARKLTDFDSLYVDCRDVIL